MTFQLGTGKRLTGIYEYVEWKYFLIGEILKSKRLTGTGSIVSLVTSSHSNCKIYTYIVELGKQSEVGEAKLTVQ